MPTSDNGLSFLKGAEKCVLTAYPDPESELGQACGHFGLDLTEYRQVPRWQLLHADPVTIGWGHTGGVRLGDKITQAQADAYLAQDVQWAEQELQGLNLNQNQFDALVSLVYNIGAPKFAGSTIKRYLESQDWAPAAEEFLKWDHSDGHVVKGLMRRRQEEQALFLRPVLVAAS